MMPFERQIKVYFKWVFVFFQLLISGQFLKFPSTNSRAMEMSHIICQVTDKNPSGKNCGLLCFREVRLTAIFFTTNHRTRKSV